MKLVGVVAEVGSETKTAWIRLRFDCSDGPGHVSTMSYSNCTQVSVHGSPGGMRRLALALIEQLARAVASGELTEPEVAHE
jgi:hypothetical protein